VFLPFLKEHFPRLLPDYEKRFADRAFLPGAYRKRISALFAQLRIKHGIRRDSGWKWEAPSIDTVTQLNLF
jgi:hypothetical protein